MPQPVSHLLKLTNAVDLLHNHLAPQSGHATQLRHKRETVDHIGSVIDEIQESLGKLEASFVGQQDYHVNRTSTLRRDGAKCFMETTGKVNCSDIIYEDENSWRKSRQQIDLMIKVLKNKIVNLKGIKKHLKDHRPQNVGDYEESVEDDSIEAREMTTRRSSRKHHHQHHNHHTTQSTIELIGKSNNQSRNHEMLLTRTEGTLVKTDRNEIPEVSDRMNNYVLSSSNYTATTKSTPTTLTATTQLPRRPDNRRSNRTQLIGQRHKTRAEEIAEFKAEHQAMFHTTKEPMTPKISTTIATQLNPNVSEIFTSKSQRGKVHRRPPTTVSSSTTPSAQSSSTVISNELSSMNLILLPVKQYLILVSYFYRKPIRL